MFDNSGNLWVVTDMSSSRMNDGIYETFKNNGAFVPPARSDGKTLFIAVQHPGEESESRDNPSSTWPDGDEPKSSLAAITGFAQRVGSGRSRIDRTEASGPGVSSTSLEVETGAFAPEVLSHRETHRRGPG